MGFYKEEDCQLLINEMTLKDDLRGKIVLLQGEYLKEEYKNPNNQFCMVTGGSGCTLGFNDSTLLMTMMINELESRVSVYSCIGVAKEKILPDWVKEKREKLAPSILKNEEWLTRGKELPHEVHELYGEYRLLTDFNDVYLLVSREQRNPYHYQSPKADKQNKHDPPLIRFAVATYHEKNEDYTIHFSSYNFEDAKAEFAMASQLVSENLTVTPSEAKLLAKACALQVDLDICSDIQEEFTFYYLQSRFTEGQEKQEILDFEDVEEIEKEEDEDYHR